MATFPLQQFLDDLDKILDGNPKHTGNRDTRLDATHKLLEAADQLFEANATVQKHIKDETLQ